MAGNPAGCPSSVVDVGPSPARWLPLLPTLGKNSLTRDRFPDPNIMPRILLIIVSTLTLLSSFTRAEDDEREIHLSPDGQHFVGWYDHDAGKPFGIVRAILLRSVSGSYDIWEAGTYTVTIDIDNFANNPFAGFNLNFSSLRSGTIRDGQPSGTP
jgi:hypothetical protein